MGELLNKAIVFATNAHAGQFRKSTDIPYILHPVEAASIVGTMTTDDEILAAAVLHDVVEDTNTTVEQVKELFGDRVAHLVASESENKRENLPAESTWKIRKEETFAHLKTAPLEIKMITLGDKLSNIRAIHRDYLALGDKVWNRFNQKDPKEHYWYYQSIADCILELSHFEAYKEYESLISKIFLQNTNEEVRRYRMVARQAIYNPSTMVLHNDNGLRALDGYFEEWVTLNPGESIEDLCLRFKENHPEFAGWIIKPYLC